MSNTDEILKRILLHMKYDSKKTLSENRTTLYEQEVKKKTPKISVGPLEKLGSYNEDNIYGEEEYVTRKDKLGNPLILPKRAKGGLVNVENIKNQTLSEFVKAFDGGGDLTRTCEHFVKRGQYPDKATCFAFYKQKHDQLLIPNTVAWFEIDGKKYTSCWPVIANKTYIPLSEQNFFLGYSTWCESNQMYVNPIKKSLPAHMKNTSYTGTGSGTEGSKGVSGGIKGGSEEKGELGGKLAFDLN